MDPAALIPVFCAVCGCTRSRRERVLNGYQLDRCALCGFVFVNPQPTPDALWKLYSDRDTDALVRLYARIQGPEVQRQHDRILDLLDARRPGRGRLLDFGCGAGYFVERAAHRGWDAHGLEAGRWAQEAAQARGVQTVALGALADGVFPPESFDVVCANQVLEHLPAPADDLRQLFAVLRPGGLLYANVPNYGGLSVRCGRDDFELNMPPQHLNYFTPRSLRALVGACGFRVSQVSSYGGLKWENLFGRPVRSSIAQAYREPSPGGAPAAAAPPAAGPSRLKRLAMPVVSRLLYRMAKVGMNLEIVAEKPGAGAAR